MTVKDFPVKTDFSVGGFRWTVIENGDGWVKCLATEVIARREFDKRAQNDFAASDLCAWLNSTLTKVMIDNGVPDNIFSFFDVDLTAEDGGKNYGSERVCVGLITCDEYRRLRDNIPAVSECWWTATPDSPTNTWVRFVVSDGALCDDDATEKLGVRPICVYKNEVLSAYLEHKEHAREEVIAEIKRTAQLWDITVEEIFCEE